MTVRGMGNEASMDRPGRVGASEEPQATTPPPWPQLAATARCGRSSNRRSHACSKKPQAPKLVGSAGSTRPFLLVPSLDSGLPALRPSGRLRRSPPLLAVVWASKEKGLAGRQASESPPQASNLATANIKSHCPMEGGARPAPHPSLLPGGEKEPNPRKGRRKKAATGEHPRDSAKRAPYSTTTPLRLSPDTLSINSL
jgi:hypothetical protein